MTQKKISGILLLLTMIALLASCRKQVIKYVEPEPVPVPGKLAKLEYTNGYDSLFYNSDGAISRIKNYYTMPGPYTEIFSFEYNSDKTVSRITDNNGESYEYRYSGGQLVAVMHYVKAVKQDYRMYDYENGRLSSVEEYYQVDPSSGGHEFTAERKFFYHPDGNLKQEVNYSFDPQTHAPIRDFTIEHLDYDSKFNPIDNMGRFLYLAFVQMSKNNSRKMTAKNELSGAFTEFNYEYTYDAAANPLTRKMTYTSNGQPVTELITYHYYQ
jgi:hypothetical protein